MTKLGAHGLLSGGVTSLFTVDANNIVFSQDHHPHSSTEDTSIMKPFTTPSHDEVLTMQLGGTLLGIIVELSTNANSGSVVFQWLKNGGVVGTGAVFGAGETGEKSGLDEISFVNGDTIALRVTVGGAGAFDFKQVILVWNTEIVL
jgi:hypothetical protein